MSSLLLFLALFTTYLLPAQDADLGWHLRFGQYFLQHGYPLLKNTLTILLHNQPWPNSYTLYQPLLALTYQHLGFWGLSILNSLFLTASFFIIWLFLDKNTTKTTLVALTTTVGGWFILRYGIRGQITAPLFLSLFLYLLHKTKFSLTRLSSLFFLFFLWANFHGSYFYGLLLVILFSTTQLFISFLNKQPRWTPLLNILPASLAPLINPHGLQNYSHVFTTFSSPLDKMIAEWVPPPLPLKILILYFFLTYLVIFFQKPKQNLKKNLFWILATLSALYLSLSARRNLSIFFLIQSLALIRLISVKKLEPLTPFFSILGLLLALTLVLPRTIQYNSHPQNYCNQGEVTHPCQAIDYLKQNLPPGRIFNFYRWGGYLTWQLPESLPFIAGHIPARPLPSGQYPYKVHLEIIQARPDYQDQLDKYQIDYLLIPPGTFLDLELADNPQAPWQKVYQDQVAVLYKRKS